MLIHAPRGAGKANLHKMLSDSFTATNTIEIKFNQIKCGSDSIYNLMGTYNSLEFDFHSNILPIDIIHVAAHIKHLDKHSIDYIMLNIDKYIRIINLIRMEVFDYRESDIMYTKALKRLISYNVYKYHQHDNRYNLPLKPSKKQKLMINQLSQYINTFIVNSGQDYDPVPPLVL